MSARNGDKARFGKQRKKKMAHRARTAILLESLKPEKAGSETPAPMAGHEEHHTVLAHAAESIGSVIGSVAAKVKNL